MPFNSVEFFVFLPIALIGSSLLKGSRRRLWLVALSYIFYGWGMPWHCLLLAASTLLDFNIGKCMAQTPSQKRRKALLMVSLLGNLGLLAVFKYEGVAVHLLNQAFSFFGLNLEIADPEVLLPVGISFYTFQT